MALAGLVALALPIATRANMSAVPIRLILTVADSCKIDTPSRPTMDPDGKVRIPLESVITGCAAPGVPAILTVATVKDTNGYYLATVNF